MSASSSAGGHFCYQHTGSLVRGCGAGDITRISIIHSSHHRVKKELTADRNHVNTMSETERLPMPERGEPTTSYEGAGTFRPAPLMPWVTGPAAEPTAELKTLLRKRMLMMIVIGLCGSVVVTATLTPGFIYDRSWKYHLACFWLLDVLATAAILVLRSRREISLRGLRAIELGALGILVAVLTWHTCNLLIGDRGAAIFARLAEHRGGVPLRPFLAGPQAPPTRPACRGTI